MVFEEAARLSYQLRQLWPQASALTPKAPAHSDFSHSGAQTHRPPDQQMSSYLSCVRKNLSTIPQLSESRIILLELSVGV